MGMIEIGRLDSGGVNKDTPYFRLAPNEFNDVLNVDFENEGVVPSVKEQGAFPGVEGNPVHMEEVEGAGGLFNFVYFTEDRAFSWAGGAFHEITNVEGMGVATEANRWNGGFYHGWWIWTNGDDVPQKWNPHIPTNPMQDLDNWPPGVLVRFIVPYLNFLVGLSYTSVDAGFSKQTVLWSDQADPGTLPNWDITDPTSKAGVFSLTADSDPIEGAFELRGELFIYKRSSIWSMRYVGGTFVMSFAPRFRERGVLNSRCVVPLEGAHFCVDRAGFYIHNGVSIKSVGEGKVWDFFSDQFSVETLSSVFLEYEEAKNRIWIFYSTKGSFHADRVLIYSLRNETWTFRSVQQASCAVRGTMQNIGSSLPWDHFYAIWEGDVLGWGTDNSNWGAPVTWDNHTEMTVWNDAATGGVQRSIHYASFIDTAKTVFDPDTGLSTSEDVQWLGSTQYPPIWYVGKSGERLQGYLQRVGFCVLEQDASGAYFIDQTVYKHLTELYVELDDSSIEIRVGTHPNTKTPVTWGEWVPFDPLVDLKLDPHCTDKYLALEFRGIEGSPFRWRLSGFSLNVQNGGRY